MGYEWMDMGFFLWMNTATLLNFLAAVIAFKSKRCHLGFYRHLTVGFCLFNGIYSIVLYFTRPVTFIYGYTWFTFSYPYPQMSLLTQLRSKLAFLTPHVYAVFDLLWLSYFTLLFYNRYILVCK